VAPCHSTAFRVLTKRSLSDKKSGPAHSGGARRPRGAPCAGIARSDAVEALPGLGARSAERLRAAGIADCGALAARVSDDEAGVRALLGNLGHNSKHWRAIVDAIGAPP
jgi:predicted flap endonuclease-1-like 5' DNA nuclease